MRKTTQNRVKTGTWVYCDSVDEFGYDQDSPLASWQVSDAVIVYTPEEAQRLKIRVKGKWTPPPGGGKGGEEEICPVCSNPISHCICGFGGDSDKPIKLIGKGSVPQAFQ